MPLTVLDPGFFSLLVDHGRPRSRHLGVPVGGAADRAALALGNALLGNPADAPAVELTMTGPTVRADARTAVALFGSPFVAAVANKGRVEAGTAFTLDPGDVLKIGGTPAGARAYLCAAGGFDPPAVLGSRSSLEPLKAGDVLPCRESHRPGRGLPFAALPDPEPALRVLPGPQFDWFLDPAAFTAAEYTVSPASNRMGLRLRGPALERRPGELVSEAVAPGAVQVANDGQPIVLGVDGQTIGGYPKVAHLIRADLDRLAQLRPGQTVRFALVTPAEAEAAARARAEVVAEWVLRLAVSARSV